MNWYRHLCSNPVVKKKVQCPLPITEFWISHSQHHSINLVSRCSVHFTVTNGRTLTWLTARMFHHDIHSWPARKASKCSQKYLHKSAMNGHLINKPVEFRVKPTSALYIHSIKTESCHALSSCCVISVPFFKIHANQ